MEAFYTRFLKERFDPSGRLTDCRYDYPENFNYGYDVIDVLGERYPERLAMLWRNDRGEERRLTFGDISDLSGRAANLFRRLGLGKGDVLLCALRSHWEYWIAAIAAHKLGLILSPVYYRLSQEELFYRMETAGARAVLCCLEGETPRTVSRAADRAGVPLRLALGEAEGFENFSRLLLEESPVLERTETRVEDPILLYFTSGSTGKPKGLLHDHAYTLSTHFGARYMQDVHEGSLHFATGDTGWEVVSGTKFYGQWLQLGALLVFDYDRFPPEQVLALLEETRATSIIAQPTVYRQLTDAGMDRYDLSSITNFAVGGEKLTADLGETVQRQTGQWLYEGYAQSETGLIAANSKNMGRRAGSVGRILPKYRLELRRRDGSFAAPGEEGEIVILAPEGRRPPGVTMGYLRDGVLQPSVGEDGIFPTGDLAVKDEDGFLYYRGRMDGMIKTKGYRVSPVEIEDLLSRHPAVYECMAAGVPDRDLGERLTVYVRLREGYAPSPALEEELLAFHNGQCAGYKKIRDLLFVPALARNSNGKLIRDQFRGKE